MDFPLEADLSPFGIDRSWKSYKTAILIGLNFAGLNFASRKTAKFSGFNFLSQSFQKFRVDLISRMSLKASWKCPFFATNCEFWLNSPPKMRLHKFHGGFNFASQQSHAFSWVLISRKRQKLAKSRNLISRKLIRLK